MKSTAAGTVRTKAILIQVLIVVGLIAWFKVCLPKIQKEKAASAAADRENRIEAIFKSMVVEDPEREVAVPDAPEKRVHPQRLRARAHVSELEHALGVPESQTVDFAGGQHLTWTGTNHQLEGSFDKGRLYCLRLEDRKTGHGVMVYESSWYWHPF